MKLYNTLVMDGYTGDSYSIGIFSSKEKALQSFQFLMKNDGIKFESRIIINNLELYHYRYEDDTLCELTITQMEVDELYW